MRIAFALVLAPLASSRMIIPHFNYPREAVEFTREHDVAVIALLNNASSVKRKKKIFRAVAESETGGGGKAFGYSTNNKVFNWVKNSLKWLEEEDASYGTVTIFRNLERDDGDMRADAITYTWPTDADLDEAYNGLKMFLTKETLPEIIAIKPMPDFDDKQPATQLGDGKNWKEVFSAKRIAEGQLQRAGAALAQNELSKFVVILNSKGVKARTKKGKRKLKDVNGALSAFAQLHKGEVLVFTLDVGEERTLPIANSALAMNGLEPLDEAAVRERGEPESPLGIMVGRNATTYFDGYYEEDPLSSFLEDWKERGSGGCPGVWTEPKSNSTATRKEKRKSKKKGKKKIKDEEESEKEVKKKKKKKKKQEQQELRR